jgi:hypothetical protein
MLNHTVSLLILLLATLLYPYNFGTQVKSIQSSEFKVTLRVSVYRQSIRLGDKPLETQEQNFYFPIERLRL